MQSIGAGEGASADGVNDAGEVVGSFESGAFLWTATQHAQALGNLIPPNSGWTLSNAGAINQSGQIIATGVINNQEHAALLSPAN
jgi:uncharacterized membrane protein